MMPEDCEMTSSNYPGRSQLAGTENQVSVAGTAKLAGVCTNPGSDRTGRVSSAAPTAKHTVARRILEQD